MLHPAAAVHVQLSVPNHPLGCRAVADMALVVVPLGQRPQGSCVFEGLVCLQLQDGLPVDQCHDAVCVCC
jgi:hypothetical protein